MRTEIRFAGFGGQGVIKCALLATLAAARREGIEVAQTQSYGPEARGGACRSDVVISDREIDYVKPLNLDYFLVMSQPAMDRYGAQLDPERTVIIADGTLVKKAPDAARNVYRIEATGRAEKDFSSPLFANVIMLGALASISGILELSDLEGALEGNLPPESLESNRRALRLGYELGKRARNPGLAE